MQGRNLWQWIAARQRVLVYGFGAALVSSWTLLRFFTQRSSFDLVSQQVIVHQWLHGAMSTAHMGQTAYVPKMLLLYVPLDALPGSPRLKLILLTLVVNIITFIVIGLVAEKLLREFRVRVGSAFYAALLWFSVLAGSVFWIEFVNSRNLEVAGGLFWIYVSVRYLRQGGRRVAAGMVALGSLLFFADPLQLYMSALPVLAYGVLLAILRRQDKTKVTQLFGLTLLCYGLAKLLFLAAAHWLQLSFTDTGGAVAPALSASWFVHSASGTARAVVSLFAGAADAGKLRELANLGLLAAGFAAFTYTFVQRLLPRRLVALLACWIVVDAVVYAASGQAVHGAATARYLIMLAPAVFIGLSTIRLPRGWCRPATIVFALALGINVVGLGTTLQQHWNTGFPQDTQLASTYRYLVHHPHMHVYASTDTAMPLLYMYDLPAQKSLPLGCLAGRLVQTHFSMDQAFASNAAVPEATAAIVLDGQTIANSPNVCTADSIIAQLGQPLAITRTDNDSQVLLYRQSALQLPR